MTACNPDHVAATATVCPDTCRPGRDWLLGLLCLWAIAVPAHGERPNIVFLYADDQAAWTIGALGNQQSRTLSLDRLYAEGIGLTNAFTTTPVCSPSRAGLLTSRYGTEIGITDYLNQSREPDNGLDPGLPTWPKLLQAAGYETALIGKWHVGSRDRHLPTNNGYDLFYGFRTGPGISRDPRVETQGRVRVVPGYTPDVLADEAIRFIRATAGQRPFLVSLHFWAPHANTANRTPDGDRTWLPLSEADWRPFSNLDVTLPQPDYPDLDVPRARRMLAEYLGSVASLDRNAGRVLAALDELGIARDTVVIFTSDHGYNLGHNGIWHKGNGRWLLTTNQGNRSNMYDNSIRVPAVVRWPARLAAGRTVEQVVLNLDWFPTILDMAGVDLPSDAPVWGRSFLPLLEGKQVEWRTSFYGEYRQLHQEQVDQRMWRTEAWKLVRDSRPGKDELYNLVEDPDEHDNLIGNPSAAASQALDQLDQDLAGWIERISGAR
ncbi:MAG: sulfatase-like hydrolase/transferase [Bryobacterales bacterium]|nr:sulfatase-like hydrolase/transferase [Bryobacterales bacterium]